VLNGTKGILQLPRIENDYFVFFNGLNSKSGRGQFRSFDAIAKGMFLLAAAKMQTLLSFQFQAWSKTTAESRNRFSRSAPKPSSRTPTT
jgi:hypothetical protein